MFDTFLEDLYKEEVSVLTFLRVAILKKILIFGTTVSSEQEWYRDVILSVVEIKVFVSVLEI